MSSVALGPLSLSDSGSREKHKSSDHAALVRSGYRSKWCVFHASQRPRPH
jgi:hypothetical protein